MIAVMAGIGKLYGEAGLQESGVFAAGTVKQILNGKDFDRGLCYVYVFSLFFI